MINPDQSRAARGLLNWTQKDLAKIAGMSELAINNFERGISSMKDRNLALLTQAFMDGGVEFPDQYGVRKRTEGVKILKGPTALRELWNDVFERMKDKGGEIVITHVDEERTLKQEPEALLDHLKRLKKHGITERLLSCEGDETFLMPKKCYRWISKELFTSTISSYVYLDRVALQMWNESMIVLIQSEDAASAERKRFDFLWENAQIPK